MTKQEARKVTIVEELLAGRYNNGQAAELLDLSVRQVQRLKAEAAAHGVMSVLHHSRGVKPTNTLDPQIARTLLEVYQTELTGYNFCHATDVFAEEKGIFVGVSTLARYLKAQGIKSPKAKRRPKKHRSRDARTHEGELVEMDASGFDWLGTGSYLHLHGAVDDATDRILALHFEKEETFEGYCELMFQMNHDGHLPREIYTDARTIFAYDSKTKQKLTLAEELDGQFEKQPHFARALKELNILLIIARSPQAKGCIERLWGTLQDRLPKDMKRQGVTTIEQANEFLRNYIPYYNRKFAVQPASPDKVYLPKHDAWQMQLIFARHTTRKLDSGLSFSFNNQKFTLPANANGERIPAMPHDTLVVATSKNIGIQVVFKGLVFKPVLLQPKQKVHATPKPEVKKSAVSKPYNPHSPWRDYTDIFYSKKRKGDIFPDQLSAATHDIFADR
ncbi:MAG TPA: ISNCY family transposase [Clostridiales bacterium]|nr:ISNCY family transposase [Clostridiales bacterium]